MFDGVWTAGVVIGTTTSKSEGLRRKIRKHDVDSYSCIVPMGKSYVDMVGMGKRERGRRRPKHVKPSHHITGSDSTIPHTIHQTKNMTCQPKANQPTKTPNTKSDQSSLTESTSHPLSAPWPTASARVRWRTALSACVGGGGKLCGVRCARRCLSAGGRCFTIGFVIVSVLVSVRRYCYFGSLC